MRRWNGSFKKNAQRSLLTAFDNELKDLDHVIKNKKQAVSDVELQLKKLKHDLQTLETENTRAGKWFQTWRLSMSGS